MIRTLDNLEAAALHHEAGQPCHAMLYFNAACYWARYEMPERAARIRDCAETYRRQHFVRGIRGRMV